MIDNTFEKIIPKDIQSSVLNPIIKQKFEGNNKFEENIQKELFMDSTGNICLEPDNKYFVLLRDNIEWLLDIESKMMIRDYLNEKFLQNSDTFYRNFKQFIVLICENAIKSKFFKDDMIEISDIIVEYEFNELERYNIKLYLPKTSLSVINDYVVLTWYEYLSSIDNKFNSKIYERYGFNEEELKGPHLTHKFERGFRKENFSITFYTARHNHELINLQTVYIIFNLKNKKRQLWSDVPKDLIDNIIEIIENYPYISNVIFKELNNLHDSILKSINKLKQTTSPLTSSYYHSRYMNPVKTIKYQNKSFDLAFKRLNIFVGKNNSGKTYTLKEIYNNSDKLHFDNGEIYRETPGNMPQKEFHFIPKMRILKSSIGTYENVYSRFRQFYEKLNIMRNFGTGSDDRIWEIDNFPDVIELFTTEYSETLEEQDKILLKNGWPIFIKFKEVLENWRLRIQEFVKIKIKDPERIGKGVKFELKSFDNIVKKTIDNWTIFGSGTQELLNLIFFIEYLKYGPVINLNTFPTNILDSTAFYESIFLARFYRALFIDEPELSLHPSLLRSFFDYLADASKLIQIFIGTHSTQFLEAKDFLKNLKNDISLTLCLKGRFEDSNFKHVNITKNNIMLVIDEMFNYDVLETAVFLSKNDYEYFDLIDYSAEDYNIGEFNDMRYSQDSEMKELKKLGTVYEDPKNRIIQNAYFLSIDCDNVKLQSDFNDINPLEKAFLCQLNKYPSEQPKNEVNINFKDLFSFCVHCWDERALKDTVLKYSEEQSKQVCSTIKIFLDEIKSNGIPKKKSLIVFPENTIPYDALKNLIEFAVKNKVVIVGGMEHQKISDIYKKLEKLGNLSKSYVHRYQYYFLKGNEEIGESTFLNQAVIINATGLFTFQIKHVPVYFKKKDITEGIPILLKHQFKKILTTIGDISVFICKDFLVNHELIDKWMNIHNVNLTIVPSFTELFYPFRNKLGELVSLKDNENKLFIFANVAKYGGSGIYKYSIRRRYESGKITLLKPYEESWKSWKI